MHSVTDLLRKIAEEIKTPEKFKSHEVRVFFSAPGLNSLKTKRDPSLSESANFQWTALWLYFFKGEKYYIYRLTLTPDGKKGDRHTVHDSDSTWSLKNIRTENSPESDEVLPEEVEKEFKEILGDLGSSKTLNFEMVENKIPVTYINQSENNKEYSSDEFKKNFINSDDVEGKPYYKLFSKKPSKEQKNPFGEVVKVMHPKEEPIKPVK